MSLEKPRVTFLNRSYWPDVEATGQLLTDLAEGLTDEFHVRVVAGQPNRVLDQVHYLRKGVESRNGVEVERLTHLAFPKKVPAGRIANLLSFTRQASRALRRSIQNPAILVSETDPFLLPLVAASYARKAKCSWIAYLQDIYPDVAVALGKARESAIIRLIRRRLLRAYLSADRVVVLDSDMKRRLLSWGVPEERICQVPNWVATDRIRPVKGENPFRLRHSLDQRFVVMHSGNMGLSQNLLDVLAAIQALPSETGVLGLFVGDGAQKSLLVNWSERNMPSGRVRFLDYQPRESLGESLSAADLQIISLDRRVLGCIAPSKLYGILASGTPILAIVPESSEIWKLVTTNRLGWCVSPGDVPELTRVLLCASKTSREELMGMGSRGRFLAETRFDESVSVFKFRQILRDVLDDAKVQAPK